MKTYEFVLVHPSERLAVKLPEMSLAPAGITDAGPLIDAVRAAHGVETVVLKRLGGRRGADGRFEWYRYALRAQSAELPPGLAWERGADADQVFAEAARVAEDQPWAHPDWWPKTARWIEGAVKAADLAPVATLVQIRAWDLSAVIDVKLADGTSVYFKAVPRAFAAEPALTEWLARSPSESGQPRGRVPDVLAVDVPRRAMLLRACPGERLDTSSDLDAWERTLRDYGAVQRQCASHTSALVALGLPHLPLARLPAAWSALCADVRALRPGSQADLTDDEIAAARALPVVDWVADLAATGVPDTLEHGDLNAQNAFVSPDATAVIDWTDSAVTHPFLSLACVLNSLKYSESLKNVAEAPARLTSAYLSCWTDVVPPASLERALRSLVRLSAVYNAVHYRERIAPLADAYKEIFNAAPGYVRDALKS